MSKVKFEKKAVWIDGQPVQIISGAIHYFRVPEQLWHDRLEKSVQCGLNCVETYMCWNLHEPEEGAFDFAGRLDFEKFIKTARELGLYVIVRPGPYICSEWDNGALPSWLMNKPGIEFRRMNKPYLDAVEKYYQVILPKLKALQYDNGGPVVAMQIENEYGAYGHDRNYLKFLRQLILDAGVSIPLFTGDGGCDLFIQGGLLEGTPTTLTFGSRALESFAICKKYRPDDPPFCMEFWSGWFDAWGGKHANRSGDEVADEIDDMLRVGGNINIYMFHGGTAFGFMSGANGLPGGGDYAPDTTSYDFDALLSECGDPTEKYFKVQQVIKKYRPDAKFGTPIPSKKIAYGKVDFQESALLFDNLDNIAKKTLSISTLSMEKLRQNFGFVHYRTRLAGPLDTTLSLWGVKDRAILYFNGKQFFTYFRNDKINVTPAISIPAEGATLDILVENFGRVNYGPLIGRDFKGITDGVTIGTRYQFDWEIWSLPLNQLGQLVFKSFKYVFGQPAFHRAIFKVDEVADTFLKFPGICGVVWINGINLGRYWNIGPTETLYVPAPFLKKGPNEIIVFETEKLARPYVNFVAKPKLG